jgi:multiple sugar transport system ATP-binding protein
MSLIPLQVATIDGRMTLNSTEGWTLPLSEQNARKVSKATSNKVVLGARHSAIRLHRSQIDGSVPAKVYTVEPTGDVTFVQVFLGGATVNISLPPTFDISPDAQVWLEFDQGRVHLFDAETELALQV